VTAALRCLFQFVRRSSHERFQLFFTGCANRSVRAAHDVTYAQNLIASTASPTRKFFARDPVRRRAAAQSLTGSPFICLHRSVSLPRRASLDQVRNSLFYQDWVSCFRQQRSLASSTTSARRVPVARFNAGPPGYAKAGSNSLRARPAQTDRTCGLCPHPKLDVASITRSIAMDAPRPYDTRRQRASARCTRVGMTSVHTALELTG
jgi:hypothetical protein